MSGRVLEERTFARRVGSLLTLDHEDEDEDDDDDNDYYYYYYYVPPTNRALPVVFCAFIISGGKFFKQGERDLL